MPFKNIQTEDASRTEGASGTAKLAPHNNIHNNIHIIKMNIHNLNLNNGIDNNHEID